MEIIIGAIQPPALPVVRSSVLPNELIEGKLLHVRPPRKGIAGPSGMERRGRETKDPAKGKVLTVMVPDGDLLPRDIDPNDYALVIRLKRKH
jgi:hypothetical protein